MTGITLGHYLSLGAILFSLSVIGIFLNRKNLIVLLMAIELMLLAVNLNFVAFSHYLILAAILFAISIVGIFLNRKNLIVLLMAIELMLLAVNLNFVAFSHYLNDLSGQLFVFFILVVAAAESGIGLAILVVLFRNLSSIDVEDLDSLKG